MAAPTTRSFELDALTFLDVLSKYVQSTVMYNTQHPASKQYHDASLNLLENLLEWKKTLFVTHRGGRLFIQERPTTRKVGGSWRLIPLLEDRYIAGFAIHRGVSHADLTRLVEVLSMKTAAVLDEDGDIRESIRRGFSAIELRDLRHAQFTEEEILSAEPDSSSLERRIEKEISSLTSRIDRRGANEPGSASSVRDAMDQVFRKMSSEMADVNSPESAAKAREIFESFNRTAAEKFNANLATVSEGLRGSVARMPESVQKALFGRTFSGEGDVDVPAVLKGLSADVKGALLANEIKLEGASGAELSKRIDSLLSGQGEIVSVAEGLARRVYNQGVVGEEDRRVISHLFHVIQGDARGDSKERIGKIIYADRDESLVLNCRTILDRIGYEVLHFTNGEATLEAVRREDPDLLITDINLEEKSGIQLVSQLQLEHKSTPILVTTAMKYFRDVHEMNAFPNMRFLTKPFEFNEFFSTIEKISRKRPRPQPAPVAEGAEGAPAAPVEEIDPVKKADMEKARMIQQSLLPSEIPQIPGMDIGASYHACLEIGGDYFDFIPMQDGRTGIVIADVSGKAVSGAMVMVLARTIFRTLAPSGTSPKEVLIRVNRELSKDIRRGMFLTAYFAIVDGNNGTVTMCCSGHNPALHWSEQFGLPTYLMPGGMAMGLIASKVYENALREETIRLLPSDRLVFFTDGVVESMDPKNDEFGEGRLAQVVSGSIRKTCKELNESILAAVRVHQSTAPQHDDITIVSIGYGG